MCVCASELPILTSLNFSLPHTGFTQLLTCSSAEAYVRAISRASTILSASRRTAVAAAAAIPTSRSRLQSTPVTHRSHALYFSCFSILSLVSLDLSPAARHTHARTRTRTRTRTHAHTHTHTSKSFEQVCACASSRRRHIQTERNTHQSRASRCVRAPLVARACVRVLVVRTGLCLCFLVYMCISPSFSVSSKIFVHSTSCRRSGCRPTAYVFFWGVTIFSTVPEL